MSNNDYKGALSDFGKVADKIPAFCKNIVDFYPYLALPEQELDESDPELSKPIYAIAVLREPERNLIAAAEAFFIATAYQAMS